MKVRGEVFSGVLRGMPLIEKYYPRLVGLLGFSPYKGTVNIKLEKPVDIMSFATKTIEHILTDGKKVINAYMAPVGITKITVVYKIIDVREREQEIIDKLNELKKGMHEKPADIKNPSRHECWAIQFKGGLYDNSVLELISKDIIKEQLNMDDGDKIEIEFSEVPVKNKKRRFKLK